MGVNSNLNIVPKSNSLVKLEDIELFISRLASNGYIVKEFTILTGNYSDIINISYWDFEDTTASSDLIKPSTLEIIKNSDIKALSQSNNYAFKVNLTKTNSMLENLTVFKCTEKETFPIFILFFGKSIGYSLMNQNEETEDYEETLIPNINCIITSSGRNLNSLDGLEDETQFEDFFELIRHFFGEFKIGIYCD